MQRKSLDPRLLAVAALMIPVVWVLTYIKLFPTPDGGYIHPGDAGIYFCAFTFGPLVGAVTGGLGTALADWTSPYAQWGIFSLLIHGAQGLAAGWIVRRWPSVWGMVAATVVGGVIVVAGYLPVGVLLSGPAQAFASIPWNIVQVAIGGVISVPLFLLVRRAYPPITRFVSR